MTQVTKTIAVISEDAEVTSSISRAVVDRPDIDVINHKATLTKMNGTAVAAASANDIVLFKTESDLEQDILAITALREKLSEDATLLALTDDSLSLADARKLTRAGVDEVLAYPLEDGELLTQIDRWTAPAAPVPALMSQSPRFGQVITICPARGGIGASTIAANLADRLRDEQGRLRKSAKNRVALIDLDLQFGSQASIFDVDQHAALFTLATGDITPDGLFLEQSMVEPLPNLLVLTSPRQFAPLDALDRGQVVALIDHLRAQFDFVVIDLPRTLVPWLAGVLERTDKMLLVTDTTVPSILQSRRLVDFFLEEVPTLNLDMVVNQERKPMIMARHHNEAVKVLERPLAHWIPSDPKTLRQCIDRGETLSAAHRRSPVAKAIFQIGTKIIADNKNNQAASAQMTV